jgi:hypothetical protein
MPFCNKCGTEVPENTNFCQKCGKGQKETNPSGKMHKQRLAIAICAAIGIFAMFMPWVNVPILGSANAMEIGRLTKDFGSSVYQLFVAPIAALVFAFSGDRTRPIWMWRGLKINNKFRLRGNPVVYLFSLMNVFNCLAIPLIIAVQTQNVGRGSFGGGFDVPFSMGFGFHLATLAAIGMFFLSFKRISKKLFGNDGFDTETPTSNTGE